jgi:hypothetical protein
MRFLVVADKKDDDTSEVGRIGTKRGKNNNIKCSRYIHGDLIAPPTCGDVFKYSVNSYMPADHEAADTAVFCEYFEAILEGFDICHQHMVHSREGTVTCLPLSGCELPGMIDFLDDGNHDLKLVASPVYSTPDFRSSQGDIIWTAQMSKEDLKSNSREKCSSEQGWCGILSERTIYSDGEGDRHGACGCQGFVNCHC